MLTLWPMRMLTTPSPRTSHILLSAETTSPVFVFPITGGPCAGKTTAIAHLLEHQTAFFPDYDITVVPEAATLYHQYGGRLPFGQPASRCGRVTEGGRNLLWEMVSESKRLRTQFGVFALALSRRCPFLRVRSCSTS